MDYIFQEGDVVTLNPDLTIFGGALGDTLVQKELVSKYGGRSFIVISLSNINQDIPILKVAGSDSPRILG